MIDTSYVVYNEDGSIYGCYVDLDETERLVKSLNGSYETLNLKARMNPLKLKIGEKVCKRGNKDEVRTVIEHLVVEERYIGVVLDKPIYGFVTWNEKDLERI